MRRVITILGCALLLGACVTVDEHGNPLRADMRRPDDPSWRIDRGSVLAAEAFTQGAAAEIDGNWKAAREAYSAIEENDLADLRSVLARARTFHAQGNPRGAMDLLERELRLRPTSYELLSATADSVLATGDLELALGYYQQAALMRPDDAPLSSNAIAALMLAGDHATAMAELERVPPRKLAKHLLIPAARTAMLADQPRYAVSALRLHLAVHPRDAEIWLELARAHVMLWELTDAREALVRLLLLDPHDADAFVLLGHVRYLTGDDTRALRCYESAIKNGASRDRLAPLMSRLVVPGVGP